MQMQNGHRVLVVEDDPSVRRLLVELLNRDGFGVDAVGSGGEVSAAMHSFRPDLVVLDLGLPDMGGIDVLRELRSTVDLPIIVLSGRTDEADRVLALEVGADDYVVKPFLNGEFVARVRARLRRTAVTAGPPVIGDGDLQVDLSAREVRLAGEAVSLTAKEFDLLGHLVSSPRQVFSRAQLLESVWQSSSEWQGESTVTEHIHRLRQKLGDDRIATVRGVGYRFDPARDAVS
ncbi:response regulator transcription factor [Actinospongicola halichondriae]|uniref:response regulator transcription factor n=1 Tax=Actinospongicola halichondriae TaxID=3236844 RepID=UPI003D5A9B4A